MQIILIDGHEGVGVTTQISLFSVMTQHKGSKYTVLQGKTTKEFHNSIKNIKECDFVFFDGFALKDLVEESKKGRFTQESFEDNFINDFAEFCVKNKVTFVILTKENDDFSKRAKNIGDMFPTFRFNKILIEVKKEDKMLDVRGNIIKKLDKSVGISEY